MDNLVLKSSDDKSKELSIFDLLYVVQKKYLSIIILSIILSVFFFFIGKIFLPNSYSGSLYISKATESSKYNNYLLPNYSVSDLVETEQGFVKSTWIANYNQNVITQWNEILNSESLFDQYSTLLKSKKPILDFINNKKDDLSLKDLFGKNESSKVILQSFDIEKGDGYIIISFQHSERDDIENAIFEILEYSQNDVFKIIEAQLINLLKNAEASLVSKRLDAKINLDLFKKNFRLKIEQEISFLKEQSEIARSLGIEKGVLNNIVSQQVAPDSVEIAVGSNIPYYYYGFKAIDKEIEVRQSNLGDNTRLIESDEFSTLSDLLTNLENVSTVSHIDEKLRELTENYIENPKEFLSTAYIRENILIEKIGYNQKLLNIIYVILSIGLSILFIFISDLYIRFLEEKNG